MNSLSNCLAAAGPLKDKGGEADRIHARCMLAEQRGRKRERKEGKKKEKGPREGERERGTEGERDGGGEKRVSLSQRDFICTELWSSLSVCLSVCLPIYRRARAQGGPRVGEGSAQGGRKEAAPTKSHEVTQG